MEKNEDILFDKIHNLVTEQLENNNPEDDSQQLRKLIVEDSKARHIYIEYIQELYHMASRLSPLYSNEAVVDTSISNDNNVLSQTGHRNTRFFTLLALSATLVLCLSWLPYFVDNNSTQESLTTNSDDSDLSTGKIIKGGQSEVATLIKANNAVWKNTSLAVKELTRLQIDQELSLTEGSIELVFDSGVEALILAPCQVTITDGAKVSSKYGRISARVGEGGKGFVVETPLARVTDMGTEFGVVVGKNGETDVAVFEGEVDLEYLNQPDKVGLSHGGATIRQLLYQGQALKVNTTGSLSRISSIDDRWLPSVSQQQPIHSRSKIIASIQDNITDLDPELRSFYRIVHAGLREDSPAYVDRVHQWNSLDESGLPEALIGADYVMPFNDDKYIPDLEVELDVARPATIYIFISDTVSVPLWLSENFEDTGWDIGLDEGPGGFEGSDITLAEGAAESIDSRFSVYMRVVHKPQKVSLGGLEKPQPTKIRLDKRKYPGYNMYGVAAVAL